METNVSIIQQHGGQLVAEGVVVDDVGPGGSRAADAELPQFHIGIGQQEGCFFLHGLIDPVAEGLELPIRQPLEFHQGLLSSEADEVDAVADLLQVFKVFCPQAVVLVERQYSELSGNGRLRLYF